MEPIQLLFDCPVNSSLQSVLFKVLIYLRYIISNSQSIELANINNWNLIIIYILSRINLMHEIKDLLVNWRYDEKTEKTKNWRKLKSVSENWSQCAPCSQLTASAAVWAATTPFVPTWTPSSRGCPQNCSTKCEGPLSTTLLIPTCPLKKPSSDFINR